MGSIGAGAGAENSGSTVTVVMPSGAVFHWNRMGFTTRQQTIWARAAREAILGN